jgi:hypothetical protein
MKSKTIIRLVGMLSFGLVCCIATAGPQEEMRDLQAIRERVFAEIMLHDAKRPDANNEGAFREWKQRQAQLHSRAADLNARIAALQRRM